MLGSNYHLRLLLLGLALVGIISHASPSLAWMNLRVTADEVDVDVAKDGSAVVTHRLFLRVRGGPLKEFVVEGVDEDAVPDPRATITRARSGVAAGVPLALIPSLDGQRLRFELVYKKGVRTGTYLVQFSYTTELKERGLLTPVEDSSELLWVGPDLPDGVDSLRVNFSFPRGETPPRLPGAGRDEELGLTTQDDGVFLSQLRREGNRDVFILTRPHAAKNERVKWRIRVDPEIFGLDSAQASEAPHSEPTFVSKPGAPKLQKLDPPWTLGVGLFFSLLFATLVLLKSRARGLRFLFKLRRVFRAPLLLISSGASVLLAVVWERPTPAALSLCAAFLLAVQLPKPRALSARGPGRWQRTPFDSLPALPSRLAGPAWLDVGRPSGFLLFAMLQSVCVVVSLRLLVSAPYYSAMVLVYGCAWVSVFCTLGKVSAPVLEVQRSTLAGLSQLLARKGALTVTEIARHVSPSPEATLASGRTQPDELRLQIDVPHPRAGLLALEVGVELRQSLLATIPILVVIVRVREGSKAHEALPRGAQWSRGRETDERVALLRPQLPTAMMCADLARGVVRSLSVTEGEVARSIGRSSKRTPSRRPIRRVA